MNEKNDQMMLQMGADAKQAANTLATLNTEHKNKALDAIADQIEEARSSILPANAEDVSIAKANSVSGSFLDRMILDEQRLSAMADGIRNIRDLADPVGNILASTTRPNGLKIDKIATPIGVIGVIFESRPNVTSDAAALCLKSGNAVILRGGSATILSNRAIHDAISKGLESVSIDAKAIQLVDTVDRSAVGELLSGLNGNVDVIVPRGGKSLVARVQQEARVPVFAHLEGICHTYVHQDANPQMAKEIVLNAKLRRTGICGATETLLVDKTFDDTDLVEILTALSSAGCELRGDREVVRLCPTATTANESDWGTEYLDVGTISENC